MTSTTKICDECQPLVSIGVASYNNARFIIETLDSIANQTYKNIEIIINEDASTDNSLELIQDWVIKNDNIPVVVLISETNEGVCKAANRYLHVAKGKYIGMIASDDRFLPEFIEKRVKFLEKSSSDVGLCYSMSHLINEQGEYLGIENRQYNPSGYIFDHITSGFGSLCKPLTNFIKHEVFNNIGYYDESLLYEDWDWYLRVSKIYKIGFFDSLDTEYRNVAGSLGKNLYTEAGIQSQIKIIEKNLNYSRQGNRNLRKRLFRIAKTAYEQDLGITKFVLATSLKYFYGMKEFLFYILVNLRIKNNFLIQIKSIFKWKK